MRRRQGWLFQHAHAWTGLSRRLSALERPLIRRSRQRQTWRIQPSSQHVLAFLRTTSLPDSCGATLNSWYCGGPASCWASRLTCDSRANGSPSRWGASIWAECGTGWTSPFWAMRAAQLLGGKQLGWLVRVCVQRRTRAIAFSLDVDRAGARPRLHRSPRGCGRRRVDSSFRLDLHNCGCANFP